MSATTTDSATEQALPGALSIPPKAHNTLSYAGAALVFCAVLVWRSRGTSAALFSPAYFWIAVPWLIHFLRRSFEAQFVHRYSGRRIPLGDYLVEYLYYWGFATWIAIGLSSSSFVLPPSAGLYLGLGIFAMGECGNAWAHQKLRALRGAAGQSERNIPRGGLFELISCPHYLFEIISWVGFAVMTRLWGAYAFLGLGAGIVSSYALARHKAYLNEFDGQEARPLYPKQRKAIFPYLL